MVVGLKVRPITILILSREIEPKDRPILVKPFNLKLQFGFTFILDMIMIK